MWADLYRFCAEACPWQCWLLIAVRAIASMLISRSWCYQHNSSSSTALLYGAASLPILTETPSTPRYELDLIWYPLTKCVIHLIQP
ncbi:hypothetical protein J6590_035594 [Homalodisca vitripennis]|nr:hypothetical protein J6590_035594 [Homalodisca vitripennis]